MTGKHTSLHQKQQAPLTKEDLPLELEITHYMELTAESFAQKVQDMADLNLLHLEGSLKGRFTGIDLTSVSDTRYNYKLSASGRKTLYLSLQNKGKRGFCLTARSSFFTGDFPDHQDDQPILDALISNLKCTRFEVRSILGYINIEATSQLNLDKPFFEEKEMHKIKERNIQVHSIKAVTFMDFGK